MTELVMWNAENSELKLYRIGQENDVWWAGTPYVVWSTLEIAISYGWEVVGEL